MFGLSKIVLIKTVTSVCWFKYNTNVLANVAISCREEIFFSLLVCLGVIVIGAKKVGHIRLQFLLE